MKVSNHEIENIKRQRRENIIEVTSIVPYYVFEPFQMSRIIKELTSKNNFRFELIGENVTLARAACS